MILDSSSDNIRWNISTPESLFLGAFAGIGLEANDNFADIAENLNDNFLDIEIGGLLTVSAGTDVFINEVNLDGIDGGVMKIDEVVTLDGNVSLRAWESILAANLGLSVAPDVVGNSIKLEAGVSGFSGTINGFGSSVPNSLNNEF